MLRIRSAALSVAFVVCSITPLVGQAQRADASRGAAAGQSLVAGIPDSALLADLRFRSIGPAIMSGRVSDIAVPAATRPGERFGRTIYIASAAGGVWKTINGGVTWDPIFDAPEGFLDRCRRGGAIKRQRCLRGHR